MMKSKTYEHLRSAQSILLIFVLVFGSTYSIRALAPPQKPIIITFGQPNIWSLEQAHYLLARMHREDLDLRTKALGDLDPNETNSQRVEIVKTLLEIGIKFDDVARINNQLKRQDRQTDVGLREALLNRQSTLRQESTQLARDIAQAKIARSRAETDEEKARIDAEILAKTDAKAAVDGELSSVNQDLSAIKSNSSGDFSATTDPGGFDRKLPDGALETALKAAAGNTTNGSSLTASQKLTNHVNLQYEIIAKQLTLLRDEVGPGERLIFLELPQSIKTSQNKAEDKIAQTWWRIASYSTIDKSKERDAEYEKLRRTIEKLNETIKADESTLIDLQDKLDSLKATQRKDCRVDSESPKQEESKCATSSNNACCELLKAIRAIENRQNEARLEQYKTIRKLADLTARFAKLGYRIKEDQIRKQRDEVDRVWAGGSQDTSIIAEDVAKMVDKAGFPTCQKSDDGRSICPINTSLGEKSVTGVNNRTVRTLDIIPRENAVIVDDKKEKVSATGIVGAFSFLFGLGGKIQFQRQKDTTEQFMNQELYTSGFGKGQTEFGWNFYPFSGTDQIAPGIRTTYAVAIVPENAETIVLNSKGCYMDRKQYQPTEYAAIPEWNSQRDEKKEFCDETESTFVVKIPGGGDAVDFYATAIRYEGERQPGDRTVVSISGKNFSPNVGVLVDGVALRQAVGLAREDVESTVFEKVREGCVVGERVCGRYERVDSTQILLSFRMSDTFKGIPDITLVAPGKAISINNLDLQVNGEDGQLKDSKFMFGRRAAKPQITIDDFKIVSRSDGSLSGILSGDGFGRIANIYVNGVACTPMLTGQCILEGSGEILRIVRFSDTTDDLIALTLEPTAGNGGVINKSYNNPNLLRVIDSTIFDYVAATDSKPQSFSVRLDGMGFTENVDVRAEQGRIESVLRPSPSLLVVRLTSTESAVLLVLEDRVTKRRASVLLTMPPKNDQ